ncbi:family regulatory [Fusarium longipes]|uniref:Family regulatory n=1 Tax=Fusarium longipes TaxID=694270 RepID=A0A395SIT5_9HYPO|nr:family regulatory [Fusarium longipes]
MSFFSSPIAPERVASDEVIPLHVWDDTPLYRRVAMYNLKVFDDVLDPGKLRASLETLVSQKTWRKLGGRLRKKDDGYLEYHIPAPFTKERPAIGFTHADLTNISKDDHPIASRIPKPSTHPAIVGDPEETVELACGPGCPTSIDDYLYTDHPLLGLHVVSFKDATLVTLHWLHIACDALGMKDLYHGWVKAMKGLEIPEQQGYDYDPLVELGKHPKEAHKLADQRMTTASLLKYAAWNGYNFSLGKKETRMVCIPGWFMKKLRASALKELAASGVKDPFLTENDVLVAWWSRIAISHLPADTDRPVTIQVAMSIRQSLEKDLLSPDKPFIANCFGFTNLLLTTKELNQKPAGETAFRMRTAVNEQRTREQVEAYQAMVLDSVAPLPILFGNGNTYQVSYSNWTRSKLFTVDFASAAVKPRDTPLHPSYIGHIQLPFKFPEGFVVVGKDMGENTWLCGYRVDGLWDKVERELDALEGIGENT